jgi:ribonuclease HII
LLNFGLIAMILAGLDEAGRGPVLGSLVIGCVLIEAEREPILTTLGADDSKKLTPKQRTEIGEKIKKGVLAWKLQEISATKINAAHQKGMTLNEIEEANFAYLLNEVTPKPDKIFLDAADVKEERFGQSIGRLLKFKPQEIISKHKGDSLFKIVGAASILAKVRRDEIIEEIKKDYGEIGSGYPGDPKTKTYLRMYYQNNHAFPPFVRTWWQTVLDLQKELDSSGGKMKQKKLSDF